MEDQSGSIRVTSRRINQGHIMEDQSGSHHGGSIRVTSRRINQGHIMEDQSGSHHGGSIRVTSWRINQGHIMEDQSGSHHGGSIRVTSWRINQDHINQDHIMEDQSGSHHRINQGHIMEDQSGSHHGGLLNSEPSGFIASHFILAECLYYQSVSRATKHLSLLSVYSKVGSLIFRDNLSATTPTLQQTPDPLCSFGGVFNPLIPTQCGI